VRQASFANTGPGDVWPHAEWVPRSPSDCLSAAPLPPLPASMRPTLLDNYRVTKQEPQRQYAIHANREPRARGRQRLHGDLDRLARCRTGDSLAGFHLPITFRGETTLIHAVPPR